MNLVASDRLPLGVTTAAPPLYSFQHQLGEVACNLGKLVLRLFVRMTTEIKDVEGRAKERYMVNMFPRFFSDLFLVSFLPR